MDNIAKKFFYMEVERQCKFALMAYEDLQQALTDYQQPAPTSPLPNSEDVAQQQASMARRKQWLSAMENYDRTHAAAQDRLWYSVQAFLVAVGNLSKLLWPPYRKGEALIPERGPELRARLEVEDDSPLALRTFRNYFEHFDMRLEEWALSVNPRRFVDSNIASVNRLSDCTSGTCLRNFDPTTFAVTFRGEIYHLRPIIEILQAIYSRAEVKARQRAWGDSSESY